MVNNSLLAQNLLQIVPFIEKNSRSADLKSFHEKISTGKLIRQDDPVSHINTMMAFYDPKIKEIFWGFHLKAQLYCFNGGHIDPEDQNPAVTAQREIFEELGIKYLPAQIPTPELVTVQQITNKNYPCRLHYDIFFFFAVDKNNFFYDEKKLATEYDHWGWYSLAAAKKMCTSNNNLQALELIEKKIKNQF